MSRQEPPSILLIGEREHGEFASAVAWLRSSSTLLACDNIVAAEAMLKVAGAKSPEWMVLLAGYRGAFANDDVERLHKCAPLARLVTLLGSWCEGETRSGRSLPGIARVYWHQWPTRAPAELLGERAGRYAGWSLPRTATPLDVSLLARPVGNAWSADNSTNTAELAIIAPTRERFRTLADAVGACGLKSAWQRASLLQLSAATTGVLVDGESLTEAMEQMIVATVDAAAGRPVVLMLDFPRWQEVERARQLGVTGVLSKPYLLGDLRSILAPCMSKGARTAAA